MKLYGKTYHSEARPLELTMLNGEKIVLTIAPVPADFQETSGDLLPEPQVPRDVARNSARAVVRDPKTQQPIFVENPHDPAYQLTMNRLYRCRLSRTVQTALRADKNVEWATPEPDWAAITDVVQRRRTAMDYYLALADEMYAAGLGQVQLLAIIQQASQQSGNAVSEGEALAAATFPARAGSGGEQERAATA